MTISDYTESFRNNDDIDAENTRFNNLLSQYNRNFTLLINDTLVNNNNSLLNQFAGKNVRIRNGTDTNVYYINRYGFLHKYKDFNNRPESCSKEPIFINADQISKFPLAEDMPSGMECGVEGNNIKNEDNNNYYWVDINGKVFNYPNDVWDTRSSSCKQVDLKNVNGSSLNNVSMSGNMNSTSICNRLNVRSNNLSNIKSLNRQLIRQGDLLLNRINNLSLSDNNNIMELNRIKNEINEKYRKLSIDWNDLESGKFDLTNNYNYNLDRLNDITQLKVTSSFTKYILWLIILIFISIMIIINIYSDENSNLSMVFIYLVIAYGIYLLIKYVYDKFI